MCPIDSDHTKGYLEQGSAFVLSDEDQAQPIDIKNLISIDAHKTVRRGLSLGRDRIPGGIIFGCDKIRRMKFPT